MSRRLMVLIITVLTAVVVGTCRPDMGRIDPVTGLAYPTLEPVVWEGVE